MSRSERLLLVFLAVLAWSGVLLQADVSFTLMLGNGVGLTDAVIRFLSYFTILTNLLIAADATFGAIKGQSRWHDPRWHDSIGGCLALSIFFVSAAYTLLLRQLQHLHGAAAWADLDLHYVVPALFLAHWLLYAPKKELPWHHPHLWVAYPAVYFLYALAQGARTGLYPYPFIDAGRLGYPHAVRNGLIMLLLFWGGGFVLIAVARALHVWQKGGSEFPASSRLRT